MAKNVIFRRIRGRLIALKPSSKSIERKRLKYEEICENFSSRIENSLP